MPRRKRNKAFYIDTNIALDYVTARNRDTVLVLDEIKKRGWKCVSSTFLTMEAADYKKDSLYIIDKAIEKKWEMRKILRQANEKDLKRGDFEKVSDWYTEFTNTYANLEIYDFLQNSDNWHIAQEISFNSNLSAPDAIHLASAMVGSLGGFCHVLVSNDKKFAVEAKRIIDEKGFRSRLKVVTISDLKKSLLR